MKGLFVGLFMNARIKIHFHLSHVYRRLVLVTGFDLTNFIVPSSQFLNQVALTVCMHAEADPERINIKSNVSVLILIIPYCNEILVV